MDTIELDPRLRHSTNFLGRSAKMLINGEMVGAVSGRTFEVVNPATGAVIANVPEADKADVDIAVRAARRAFDDGVWARVSPSEKGRMLRRIADLIERDLEELAELESIDNGKPYSIARVADLPLAVDMFRYMGGWATKIGGGRSHRRCRDNFCPTRSRNRSAMGSTPTRRSARWSPSSNTNASPATSRPADRKARDR